MLKLFSCFWSALAADEIQDVRVVHPQDAHVGAPPRAALLDRLRGDVEDLHEGDRAAGDALGGLDHVVLGAEPGEGEAGAAAGLVDQGRVLHRLEDLVHGVPTGSTKQADSWPSSRPAFMSVGELGRKTSPPWPGRSAPPGPVVSAFSSNFWSASAIASATR